MVENDKKGKTAEVLDRQEQDFDAFLEEIDSLVLAEGAADTSEKADIPEAAWSAGGGLLDTQADKSPSALDRNQRTRKSGEGFVELRRTILVLKDPDTGKDITVERLFELSRALVPLLKFEGLAEERLLVGVYGVPVIPGQVLARLAEQGEVADHQAKEDLSSLELTWLKAGKHVSMNQAGEYRAERYGYLCLQKDRSLAVLSPLILTPDKLQVLGVVLAGKPVLLEGHELESWFQDLGVTIPGSEEYLKVFVGQDRDSPPQPGLYPIISGTPPVDGIGCQVEFQVDLTPTVGREMPDGSLDFRETNFVANVKNDQLVAVRRPAIPGVAGLDVFGETIPAPIGQDQILLAGENIRQEKDGETSRFYATMDGALRFINDRLSVVDLFYLEEGVNFKTGNIGFSGEVFVNGTVVSGFSVEAGGDITVTDTVENGAWLVAGGDIVVGRGIVGNRTVVDAVGSIRAQHVHEATVIAGENVELGDYSFHASLRAGNMIKINKATVGEGGSLVGSRSWAYTGMDMYIAGSPLWTLTELLVGVSTEEAEKLDRLQTSIAKVNAHLRHMLEFFNLSRIDLEKIKAMIDSASGAKRQGIAYRAKHLAQIAKQYQQLLAAREQLLAELQPPPPEAEIRVREIIYPRVLVRISSQKREINKEIMGFRMRLENDEIVD